MTEIPCENSSGNVVVDMGFSPAEAAALTVKSSLITAISDTIKEREPTQKDAARLCNIDQPTLSKVLRGRMESVTIDRLAAWLTALGQTLRPGGLDWISALRAPAIRPLAAEGGPLQLSLFDQLNRHAERKHGQQAVRATG
jgi:predicted XRE-type DNA-binding protein